MTVIYVLCTNAKVSQKWSYEHWFGYDVTMFTLCSYYEVHVYDVMMLFT